MWKSKDAHAAYQRSRYSKRVFVLREIKSISGCYQCGEKRHHTLSFHHKDPSQKGFRMTGSRLSNMAWETLASELVKCIVLCQNCHYDLHFKDGTWKKQEFKPPSSCQ